MKAGLREAHAHIASHGRSLLMPSLGEATGADDMLALAGEHAGRVAGGAWLLMIGARVESWARPGEGPSSWPTLREFDEVTGDVPAAAISFDHHMVMANSAALRRGGITPAWIPPEGGIIGLDGRGELTGLLLETAAWSLWNAAPEPTRAEIKLHVIAALKDLAGHGFVEVHDMLSLPWLGEMLAELSDAGELPLRVWMYAPIDQVRAIHAGLTSWTRKDVLLAGGKIFVDGTLNSRTAWMLQPYVHPQVGMPCGKIVTPPEKIRGALEVCMSLGIGLAAHAIGDGAVRATLDAFEEVLEPAGTGRGSSPGRSHQTEGFAPASKALETVPALRIEHAEVIDRADVARFAQLGVVASVQPCHLLADIEALRRYIPHRLDRVFPLRELIDAGCSPGKLLWFGSDTPIVRPDPADSVQAAVHRGRAGMREGDAIAPEQAISAGEAWEAFVGST